MALRALKMTQQTAREMEEGARQSKMHAKKKFRSRKLRKGSPFIDPKPTAELDPQAQIPWQHRRDLAIALAKARGEENSRLLRFARLQEALLAGAEEINGLFKEIC